MNAKYLGYALLILTALFLIEALGIYDIPYFDIPDFFSGKKELLHKSDNILKEIN